MIFVDAFPYFVTKKLRWKINYYNWSNFTISGKITFNVVFYLGRVGLLTHFLLFNFGGKIMARETYAVIGLGTFGISIVNELIALGKDVIAIDNDAEQVNKISDILPTAFVCNSTDEVALNQLAINDAEYVVVAFGDNLEATILTTVLLKDMGVKHLIVRVDNPQYINIMKKLGAEEIISPQQAAGIALANRIGNEDYKDFYKLDKKFSIVSIEVNKNFQPHSLQEMNAKNLFGISIVLIKRGNSSFVPSGKDTLLPGDNMFVVGTRKEVRAFREAINGKKRIW